MEPSSIMIENGNTVMVAAALQALVKELHLIRLTLFALCPDKDRKALTKIIGEADAQSTEGLQKILDATFPPERMTR